MNAEKYPDIGATYASIVPLIGGETLAMQNVFGKRPEYILSYTPFKNHDAQLLAHYDGEVPYVLLDEESPSYRPGMHIDVVNSVCPCAGLSSLSPSASSDNAANDWMIQTTKYVLSSVRPKVLWGENAPRLASKMGEPIVEQLRSIGKEHGYVFTLYKTKSILHGLSQVRDRTFYFFWKDERTPVLPFFKRPYAKIEDTIRSAFVCDADPMNELTNKNVPTENPFFQFALDVILPNGSFKDIRAELTRTTNIMDYIESKGVKYDEVAKWMDDNGYDKHADRCRVIHEKLERGGNVMRKIVEIPKDHIGAFVGHMPTQLMHPDQDRFLTIRECMAIMRMPADFMLQGGLKNLNMICQNVPVTTAMDMARGVQRYLLGELDYISTDFVVQDNRNQTIEAERQSNTLSGFI